MKYSFLLSGLLLAGLISSPASAAITAFSDDFESYALNQPAFSPLGNGWLFFNTNGAFDGYGGPANAAGPQISALGGEDPGNQFLNVYADYNNPLQPTEVLDLFVFQQQTFDGAEAALGETWTLDVDFRQADSGGVAPPSITGVYISVFDNSFNKLQPDQVFDTSSATGPAYSPISQLSITLDPGYVAGGIVQFGFTSRTTNYSPSGVNYDNVSWSQSVAIPEPGSFAMLGLGAIGLVARRRRRS